MPLSLLKAKPCAKLTWTLKILMMRMLVMVMIRMTAVSPPPAHCSEHSLRAEMSSFWGRGALRHLDGAWHKLSCRHRPAETRCMDGQRMPG